MFTELFGLQSYIVNGIRIVSKKGNNKAVFFQPAAVLDMEVYHNELRQLNRIKEYKWAYVYKHIFTDVLKNGIALYMVELLTKCMKQSENNPDLFAFMEYCFLELDQCSDEVMANFPVYFSVHLAGFFGISPRKPTQRVLNSDTLVFDLQGGVFASHITFGHLFLERKYALLLSEFLLALHPSGLSQIATNSGSRRKILDALETYYNLHVPDFGKMKTLPVLRELLG